ncbi:MAG: hypothetical protein Q9204_001049 [Flavoplaca sp. TL-2023a]
MSRHNRRRTRVTNRNFNPLPQCSTFGFCDLASVALRSDHQRIIAPCSLRGVSKRNDLSARHWHNRYVLWRAWERKQREAAEKLLAERKRIFGGENEEEDDDGLCSNMMESDPSIARQVCLRPGNGITSIAKNIEISKLKALDKEEVRLAAISVRNCEASAWLQMGNLIWSINPSSDEFKLCIDANE